MKVTKTVRHDFIFVTVTQEDKQSVRVTWSRKGCTVSGKLRKSDPTLLKRVIQLADLKGNESFGECAERFQSMANKVETIEALSNM